MFRRISYKLTLTNPLTNNQTTTTTTTITTTTTTTVKTKTTTKTTALRATIGDDQATKKGEATFKAEEETFTSSSIIVIKTTPVTHYVTSSPTALDRVSFDFLEDNDTLESNDLETADTVLKFSPGSTSGSAESVGFSAESSNFYSGLVDFSTESADNSTESADPTFLSDFSAQSANPTLTADLPILSADFSAEAAYNSSNELDKFSTGLTDLYTGVSRRSDTGPKISEKEESPEDIINMIVVVDLENMDTASNIPGIMSLINFPLESVYTRCPNKHGNSVTNSISSFQIIL